MFGLARSITRSVRLALASKKNSSQTNHAFDVTTGPLIKAWGFLQKKGRTPSPEKLAEAIACSGMKNIQFHEHEHKIRFDRPEVEINLGNWQGMGN